MKIMEKREEREREKEMEMEKERKGEGEKGGDRKTERETDETCSALLILRQNHENMKIPCSKNTRLNNKHKDQKHQTQCQPTNHLAQIQTPNPQRVTLAGV